MGEASKKLTARQVAALRYVLDHEPLRWWGVDSPSRPLVNKLVALGYLEQVSPKPVGMVATLITEKGRAYLAALPTPTTEEE